MTTNLHLKSQNLKMLVIENVVGVYMNILGLIPKTLCIKIATI